MHGDDFKKGVREMKSKLYWNYLDTMSLFAFVLAFIAWRAGSDAKILLFLAFVFHACGYVVSEIRTAKQEIDLRMKMFYEVIQFQKTEPAYLKHLAQKEAGCEKP